MPQPSSTNMPSPSSVRTQQTRATVGTVPEILAPAGGMPQFLAALNAGADAVYLGLKTLNARARAANFSPEELAEVVPMAHDFGMRVLVTLNILIKEAELPALIDALATLDELRVDAVIVQDIAVAALARTHFPNLRVHASTQMAIHNVAGAQAAVDLGIKRAVLARELTAVELRRIRAALPRHKLELEAFCHGSLCYSYSGLCFFSGAEDARSGNRGECAYTCREPYRVVSEPGHGFLFSMKDLDTAMSLDLMVDAGIDALKIEGRKKDAQYVAASVRQYRHHLDRVFKYQTLRKNAPPLAHKLAESDYDPMQDLTFTFTRQPTTLFLKGRYAENVIDLDSPTHRGEKAGVITSIKSGWATMKAEVDLERFDGLRIEPDQRAFHARPQDGDKITSDPELLARRYDREYPEFSLRSLRVGGIPTPTTKQGSRVEFLLPTDGHLPHAGDAVYKIRSNRVKRHTDALAQTPEGYRRAALMPFAVDIEAEPIDPHTLRVTARARHFQEKIAEVATDLPLQRPRRGEVNLGRDAGDTFAILGNANVIARPFSFAGAPDWFVRRAELKALKRRLEDDLLSRLPSWRSARRLRESASSDPSPLAPRPPMPSAGSTPVFHIKSDDLQTLHTAARAVKENSLRLGELLFEPKRLRHSNVSELLDDIDTLMQASSAPVRLAVPCVVRAWDEPLLGRLFLSAFGRGCRRFEIGNIGGRELLRAWGIALDEVDVSGDFTSYALNSAANIAWRAYGLSSVCLSVEDDLTNIAHHVSRLTSAERATTCAILFKDTPLFIAESCSLTALHNGCPSAAVCGYRSLTIENTRGERFHVAHENCKSIVYGDAALSIVHRRAEFERMGLNQFRIDFLTRPYASQAVAAILRHVAAGTSVPGTHEANAKRTLL